jgi:hypothetical protein
MISQGMRRAASFGIIAILLTVSLLLARRPYYNWDMFPYMALAIQDNHIPFETTHRVVYEVARANMSAADFNAISERQVSLRDDANKFDDALRYCDIKPGYVFTVKAFHKVGFNLLASTYLPSIISYFLLGILLLYWQPNQPGLLAQAAALLIMALPPVFQTARYSSPDILCTLLVTAGMLALIRGYRIGGYALLLTAIPFRPDAVLYLFATLLVGSPKMKLQPVQALFVSLLGILLTFFCLSDLVLLKEYLFVSADYSPGWTSEEMLAHYVQGFQAGLLTWVSSRALWATLACLFALYVMKGCMPDLKDWKAVCKVALITFGLRYLLHPQLEDRFLLVNYILIVLALLNWFQTRIMKDQKDGLAPNS